MKSSLKNMLFVMLAIALITGTAVAYVNKVTTEPIRKAKEAKIDNSLKEVLPDHDSLEEAARMKVYPADGEEVTVYRASAGGETAGYAVETYSANGYSGTIKLLVGLLPDGTINRVAVISQSETPGLGAKIAEPEQPFVVQFQGKDPADFKLAVKVDGGDVDAITASTITSRAYTDAVKRAVDAVAAYLKE